MHPACSLCCSWAGKHTHTYTHTHAHMHTHTDHLPLALAGQTMWSTRGMWRLLKEGLERPNTYRYTNTQTQQCLHCPQQTHLNINRKRADWGNPVGDVEATLSEKRCAVVPFVSLDSVLQWQNVPQDTFLTAEFNRASSKLNTMCETHYPCQRPQ